MVPKGKRKYKHLKVVIKSKLKHQVVQIVCNAYVTNSNLSSKQQEDFVKNWQHTGLYDRQLNLDDSYGVWPI